VGVEFKRNQKLALLVILGVAAIGLSISHIRNSLNSGDVVLTEPEKGGSTNVVATDSDSPYSQSKDRKVVFQVAGCVNTPGVYSLPYGSRIYEAIKAAGDAKPNADLQSLNLAAKIEDASKIVVPAVGETTNASTGMPVTQTAGAGLETRSSATSGKKFSRPGEGLVHINSAGISELQQLPGVGPSTAQKIIDYRSQKGLFKSPEQIMDVKGIGPKKYEKMRPFVTL